MPALYRYFVFLIFALLILNGGMVRAADYKSPDLLSLGVGYFDFNTDQKKTKTTSADLRLEYRFGKSLIPWTNPVGQLHPYAGVEINTRGMFYANGGILFDAILWKHFTITWVEGVGLYTPGANNPSLCSVVEFRSQMELGWKFKNDMRISIQASHISNAGLTSSNNGAEIAGLYFHVPFKDF